MVTSDADLCYTEIAFEAEETTLPPALWQNDFQAVFLLFNLSRDGENVGGRNWRSVTPVSIQGLRDLMMGGMAPIVYRNLPWPCPIFLRKLLKVLLHGTNLPLACPGHSKSRALLDSCTSSVGSSLKTWDLSRAQSVKDGLPVLRRPPGCFLAGLCNLWNCWPFSCQYKVKWGWKWIIYLITLLKSLPSFKQGFLHESHLFFYVGNLSIITAQNTVQCSWPLWGFPWLLPGTERALWISHTNTSVPLTEVTYLCNSHMLTCLGLVYGFMEVMCFTHFCILQSRASMLSDARTIASVQYLTAGYIPE